MDRTGTEFLRREHLVAAGSALAVLAGLTAGPLVLLHGALADILRSFHWTLSYLAAELGPWLLLATGVAFLLPVALSAGLHPESQFYPRRRSVYFMWGVILYLLGIALVVEVYNLWSYGY